MLKLYKYYILDIENLKDFIRAGAKKTPSSKGGDELAVFPALILLKIVIIYAIINSVVN